MNPILRNFPDAFTSARLDIRAPRAGDGAALHAAVSESWSELSSWLPWAREKSSLEETEVLVRQGQARFLLRQDLWLLLFEKGKNQLVGSSGLHRIDWNVPSFEIGYWVRTQNAGQGYMTEAVRAIADFAFLHLQARRVHIHCDERNAGSRRVAERAGFRIEATLEKAQLANDGTLANIVVYCRLA
jgi:RimJ/RimL family protein N-acetyltransferase